MIDGHLREVDRFESSMNPSAKVYVFHVHEVAFVKQANLGKRGAVDHHEAAGQHWDGNHRVIVLVTEFVPG